MAAKVQQHHLITDYNIKLDYIYSYIAAIAICYAYVAVAYMAGLFLNPAFFGEKKMVTYNYTVIERTALNNVHVVTTESIKMPFF